MFFEPNRSDIELGEQKNLDESLKKNIIVIWVKIRKAYTNRINNQYLSLSIYKKRNGRGYKIENKLRKEYKIDIVALNDETKDILFAECKWKDLNQKQAETIIDDLKEKAKHVDWNKDTRKEHHCIIAKKINDKKAIKNKAY